jgi:hypothetical protein
VSVNDRTVAKVNLVLLVAVLMAVARGSWLLAEISTKVDAMWSVYCPSHVASSTSSKESTP